MCANIINIQKESRTKYIAEELSKLCSKGDVLALSGEMGSGKTTFIRYFIKNISNVNEVPSPSYNIMLPYDSKKTKIYHMDVWRIKSYEEVLTLGITDMFENSIFLVEWAEKIIDILPCNCLKLYITNDKNNRIPHFH